MASTSAAPLFEPGLVENVDGRPKIHLREQGAGFFRGHFIERFDSVGGMQGGEVGRLGGLKRGSFGLLGDGGCAEMARQF